MESREGKSGDKTTRQQGGGWGLEGTERWVGRPSVWQAARVRQSHGCTHAPRRPLPTAPACRKQGGSRMSPQTPLPTTEMATTPNVRTPPHNPTHLIPYHTHRSPPRHTHIIAGDGQTLALAHTKSAGRRLSARPPTPPAGQHPRGTGVTCALSSPPSSSPAPTPPPPPPACPPPQSAGASSTHLAEDGRARFPPRLLLLQQLHGRLAGAGLQPAPHVGAGWLVGAGAATAPRQQRRGRRQGVRVPAV